MAKFTIDIPEHLLPALAAEFATVQGSTSAKTPEEYFAASVVETIRQRAEQYQVGPYFKGIVQPRFLADGRGNPAYTGADAIPYVVIYPPHNGTTTNEVTDPDTGEITEEVVNVEWVDGDQWTDPVTGKVYEFTDGVWKEYVAPGEVVV